ncbi:MAG: D-aminoacyl-tRNA deacylase [Thermoproteus sp.]
MIALAISADPVSKGLAKILGLQEAPGASTFYTIQWRGIMVVFHKGDSVEVPPEDELKKLGIRHLVVPSRHEMAKPRPMMTAHTPGVAPSLSVAHAGLKSWLFRRICSAKPEEYDCSMEATHHGPNTDEVSVTFIEIGSTEREWKDERALKALASAVEDMPSYEPGGAPVAMTVGDLHYSLATQDVLQGLIDLGHVVHKDVVTADLVLEALYKHVEKPQKVIVYKKSIKGPVRRGVLDVLKGAEIEIRG